MVTSHSTRVSVQWISYKESHIRSKDKIGHNLENALNMCLDIDRNSELQVIRSGLPIFPEISDRYKGIAKTLKELWHGYGIAQFTGTTVVRSLTGRDVRKTLR